MRARHWCALVGLGLAGCGDQSAVDDTRTAESASRTVEEQACPSGTASRVQVVAPEWTGPLIISGQGEGRQQLVDANGTLFFGITYLGAEVTTLWRTDGSGAGTVPAKVFFPGSSGSAPVIEDLVAVGSQVFFRIHRDDTGVELWVSDGTDSGTRLVEDLEPGPASPTLLLPTAVGGRLVFLRQVPDTGTPSTLRYEVWRSDGTAEGTFRVTTLPPRVTVSWASLRVGGALLMFVSGEDTGTSLWRTDGTASGTYLVKSLDAQALHVEDVREVGGQGLFVLPDGVNHEVWRTDGTAAGSVRLEAFGRPARLMGVVGASVYLSTLDTSTLRLQIERLSLAGGGKARVTTLPNPHAGNPDAYPSIQRTTTSGGRLYFSMAIGSSGPAPQDVQLWATDGTASGTVLLHRPLSLGDQYWSPLFATGEGPVLFGGSNGEGGIVEPWFTRGTVATTGRLTQGELGNPDGFARLGNHVYFFAYDDTEERQLWSVPASVSCPPGLDAEPSPR
ncbi:hypothetical protein LY474_19135 [Myxococcus stipitatus]|uniref:hypothetical protein n=1 Tax=Myxococcus stipitatus TaxID=83455 RepID=UPI001F2BACAD|nr:hypothetical protein [Myxococcus stipitatus]MCE9669916.1 hypothetical protein [Myxococcus stipitatus]